ncbi:MAG: hypothetical protein Q8P18_26760 [Pseudomonadota bacterium]|nr:hypothetical protein [Pseudomonadota bacterium]
MLCLVLFAFLGFAGCDAPNAEEDAALVPTPWTYTDPGAPDRPMLSASDVEGELSNVVTFLRKTDPLFIFEAREVGLARSDSTCPTVIDHNNQTFVEGDCTTADGTRFLGYNLSTDGSGMIGLPGEPVENHRYFAWTTGNLEISRDDGYELHLLGDCQYRDYDTTDGDPGFQIYLWGDFSVKDGVTTNWLNDEVGVHLYLDSVDYPTGRSVEWSGGVSRLGGLIDAVSFEDFVISETATCGAIEPSGTLWLWDSNLHWYEVAFDETCDGCADVRVDGVSIGSACQDWTPLIDWEARPW